MMVFGHDDAPHGHMHVRFTNVRIPADGLLIREGAGFEVSQGRLGPGRIHHCMRSIGQAEKALELLCKRSLEREAFGKQLAFLGANFDIIAESRIKIEQARLLCLKAAWAMDTMSKRDAAPWISRTHRLQVCGKASGRCDLRTGRMPFTAAKSRAKSCVIIPIRRSSRNAEF
jgi:acyl-CoA dehydrogenase